MLSKWHVFRLGKCYLYCTSCSKSPHAKLQLYPVPSFKHESLNTDALLGDLFLLPLSCFALALAGGPSKPSPRGNPISIMAPPMISVISLLPLVTSPISSTPPPSPLLLGFNSLIPSPPDTRSLATWTAAPDDPTRMSRCYDDMERWTGTLDKCSYRYEDGWTMLTNYDLSPFAG